MTSRSMNTPVLQSQNSVQNSKPVSATFDDLVFKIAETKSELEQAFRLVHDAYIREGYIHPHPSGIRVNLMNALPTTTTFVGIYKDRVIATISIYPDSDLGMPLDTLYQQEIDQLRQQKRRLAEVGILASEPNFRSLGCSIPLMLNKMMYLYASQYLKLDDLVITVNPKHRHFYVNILLFEAIGAIKSYSNVNNNPAILLKFDLNVAEERFYNVYQNQPEHKNLYHFFCTQLHECIHLPTKLAPVNVWTEELIDYFFYQKTDLFKVADRETLNLIKAQHLSYYASRLEQVFACSA
jgi:hypothetical protein